MTIFVLIAMIVLFFAVVRAGGQWHGDTGPARPPYWPHHNDPDVRAKYPPKPSNK